MIGQTLRSSELRAAAVATDLEVAPDDVEQLFVQHEELMGGPLDVTDYDILEAVLTTVGELKRRLLGAMYKRVFGIAAEEAKSALVSISIHATHSTCCTVMAVSLNKCSLLFMAKGCDARHSKVLL